MPCPVKTRPGVGVGGLWRKPALFFFPESWDGMYLAGSFSWLGYLSEDLPDSTPQPPVAWEIRTGITTAPLTEPDPKGK